jgi:hypothetical protein
MCISRVLQGRNLHLQCRKGAKYSYERKEGEVILFNILKHKKYIFSKN